MNCSKGYICIHRFSDLTLTNVTHKQAGNYSCVVRADNDMATGSGTLTVYCKYMYKYVYCIL